MVFGGRLIMQLSAWCWVGVGVDVAINLIKTPSETQVENWNGFAIRFSDLCRADTVKCGNSKGKEKFFTLRVFTFSQISHGT